MLPVIALLHAVAQDRNDLALDDFDSATVQWVLETGLGPLLYRSSQNSSDSNILTPWRSALLGADLTARVLTTVLLEAVDEIVATSSALTREITLLKGASLCGYHYPEPHLRTMGDIDLMVPARNRLKFESMLQDLGYRQRSEYPENFYHNHHHSMPFFHPEKRVWIEVHTSLFPLTATVAQDRVFSTEHVTTQIVPRMRHRLQTNHLSNELNIIYICSHWAETFNQVRGLVPLLDVMYLIKKESNGIDWDKILAWVKNSMAAAHLYLMLTFLQRHDLISIPSDVIYRLSIFQKYLNRPNNKILHALLNTYFIRGRPFTHISSEANVSIVWKTLLSRSSPMVNLLSVPSNLLFPPTNSQRTNPAFQLRRIKSALRIKR